MSIHVDVITPEKLTISDDVDFIAAPTPQGEIGILPRHAPLLTRLAPGELRLRKGTTVSHLALSGGFLEVQKGSVVSIFAETAENANDIDVERARLALERAQTKLKETKLQDLDLKEAEASLTRALVRLKVGTVRRRTPHKPDRV